MKFCLTESKMAVLEPLSEGSVEFSAILRAVDRFAGAPGKKVPHGPPSLLFAIK